MSEADFIRLSNMEIALEMFLCAVCMAVFFRPLLTEGGSWKNLSGRKILFLLTILGGIPLLYLVFPGDGWMKMLIIIAFFLLSAGWFGMERKSLGLFALIFFCVRSLSMMIMQSVDYFTNRYFVENAGTAEKVFESALRNFIFVALLRFFLLSLLLHGVRKGLESGILRLHIRELSCLLLTPLTGILFVNILIRLLVVIKEDSFFLLYEQFPAFLGVIPAAAALFYLGLLAAIASCRRLIALQDEQKRHFVEQQQLEAIRDRMNETEQFYEDLRRMKHEMNNHLTILKSLTKNGRYEDIEHYLGKLAGSMHVFEPALGTGNAITDVVVNDSFKAAARQGIRFESSFSYPASGGYDAYDLGIILHNLLQNALEACERMEEGEKYILLSGKCERKFFLIEMRNSFEGEISFDRDTRLPVSSKTRDTAECCGTSLHGIGLSNVKREAEKYRGDLDIKITDREFLVTVLLQEEIPAGKCP